MVRSIGSVMALSIAGFAVVFASFFPTVAIVAALICAGLSFLVIRGSGDFAKMAAVTALAISVVVLVFETAVVLSSLWT